MAEIDSTYKRRINIAGKHDAVQGWMLNIYDAQTGEKIENIHSVKVELRAGQINTATIEYHDANKATWVRPFAYEKTEADIDTIMFTAREAHE